MMFTLTAVATLLRNLRPYDSLDVRWHVIVHGRAWAMGAFLAMVALLNGASEGSHVWQAIFFRGAAVSATIMLTKVLSAMAAVFFWDQTSAYFTSSKERERALNLLHSFTRTVVSTLASQGRRHLVADTLSSYGIKAKGRCEDALRALFQIPSIQFRGSSNGILVFPRKE